MLWQCAGTMTIRTRERLHNVFIIRMFRLWISGNCGRAFALDLVRIKIIVIVVVSLLVMRMFSIIILFFVRYVLTISFLCPLENVKVHRCLTSQYSDPNTAQFTATSSICNNDVRCERLTTALMFPRNVFDQFQFRPVSNSCCFDWYWRWKYNWKISVRFESQALQRQ